MVRVENCRVSVLMSRSTSPLGEGGRVPGDRGRTGADHAELDTGTREVYHEVVVGRMDHLPEGIGIL